MNSGYLAINDRIAAIATAPGRGALAIVRISGPDCLEALSRHFSRPEALRKAPGNSVIYGFILDKNGEAVDEVTLCVFRKPHSFTGEDAIDIVCHGGSAATAAVYRAALDAQARPALPGEFTFRAFASGRIDLTSAEAVDELSRARTDEARADALKRLSGFLSRELGAIRERLITLIAAMELRLDYGDDEVEDDISQEIPELLTMRMELDELAATWKTGHLLEEGVRVAVAGRTNAGKSSLFNRLLAQDRSIVSEEHGTTRDYIEATVDIGGIPVCLVDTAGLRAASETVEMEGVRRSRLVAESSDLVIYVVDGTRGMDAGEQLPEGVPVIRVWNKSDRCDALPGPDGYLSVSAMTGSGMKALCGAILSEAGAQECPSGTMRIASIRQKQALESASASLLHAFESHENKVPLDALVLDLRDAADALASIVGAGVPDEILERIFSRFCVGK